MAAPRATQFIALRNISRGSALHNHQHVRALHMTGPATYASPLLTQERSVLNLPNDIAGLRAECKRRKIDASGSKNDLVSRLNANELLRSRAFSTAATASESKRPTAAAASPSAPRTRHFNTSRALKQVNDSSTVDFAYLPTADPSDSEEGLLRVPILPTTDSAAAAAALPETVAAAVALDPRVPDLEALVDSPVMKPEIVHVSADAVYLPMAELADNHAENVDFHDLAEKVKESVTEISDRLRVPVEQQASLMKRIFGDLVDDAMGINQRPSRGTVIPSG